MATRDDILKAAEHVFSKLGYDGSSMRLIAEAAGVAQGLLHYHFKNKEGLYEAVFETRSQATIGHRGKLLDKLLELNPSPTLEQILEVLFIAPGGSPEHERQELSHYMQMVASVGIDSSTRSRSLVGRYFDPIAHRFIQAFQNAVPGLTRDMAIWAYLFSIGARMQAHALNGRAERLRGSHPGTMPPPSSVLVPFTAAGIRALVAP